MVVFHQIVFVERRDMPNGILVKPASGKHAIEAMAFAVEWERHLSDDVLATVMELWKNSDQLRAFLPRKEEIKGVKVQIGNDGPAIDLDGIGGLRLSRLKEDGSPTWIIDVRNNLLSCNCMDYDRWNTIKPQALEIMSPIVNLIFAQQYRIQAVGLQYQDTFRVETTTLNVATHRLFSEDSKWLSPHIWDEDKPWHIHQGWFSVGSTQRDCHNLFNLDVMTEQNDCLFRINGQHRILSKRLDGASIEPLTPDDISSALEDLHLENKRVLHQVLDGRVRDQIGLIITEAL
jgi:uncharacterized protein (TIGR04255 family)